MKTPLPATPLAPIVPFPVSSANPCLRCPVFLTLEETMAAMPPWQRAAVCAALRGHLRGDGIPALLAGE